MFKRGKTKRVFALFLCIVFLPSFTITSEAKDAEIKRGISQFQMFINNNLPEEYLDSPLVVNGICNEATKRAGVKLVQYKLNMDYDADIEVDGYFGRESQIAFRRYKKYIQRYDLGYWIYILQGLLYCHGYNPKGFDGSYGYGGGRGLLNAVNTFKLEKGIKDYPGESLGRIGTEAMTRLCWDIYVEPYQVHVNPNSIEIRLKENTEYCIKPKEVISYVFESMRWSLMFRRIK